MQKALLVTILAFSGAGGWILAHPLNFEQHKRLTKYLPRTFNKLQNHDPVHVVLLGDGNLFGEAAPENDGRINGDALTGFAGVFLSKVADEFFYTGGVRLENPPQGGASKLRELHGSEIRFENLGEPGASILNGLQRIKADAFLHDPDLVIIQFGVSDAFNHLPVYTFQRSLYNIISECRQRKTDVLVLGPTPAYRGEEFTSWGMTRPYATAAMSIAKGQETLYFDCATNLVRGFGGGADPNAEPEGGMAVIGERLKRMFHIEGLNTQPATHLLSSKSHDILGKQLFGDLIFGAQRPDFSLALAATQGENGSARVELSLQNLTSQEKKGLVGALSVEGLTPVKQAQRYALPPNGSQSLIFDYQRPVVGRSSRGNVPYPFAAGDELVRFPFLIEDGVRCELLDAPGRIGPVSVEWLSRNYAGVHDSFEVIWAFVNGTSRNISGTYRIGLGDGIDNPRPFSVPPQGKTKQNATIRFAPPGEGPCFQEILFLEVEIGGATYRFDREFEASRDLVMGEKSYLVSMQDYGNAPAETLAAKAGSWNPVYYFDSVQNNPSLFCVIDLSGMPIPDLGSNAAVQVWLTLDAREPRKVRDFGAVSPIQILFTGKGGKGYVRSLPLGAFGEDYNLQLRPSGIASVLKDNQIQIKIPKTYLGLHDWQFSDASVMGFRLVVSIADHSDAANPFPAARTFVSHNSALMYKGASIRGLSPFDASSLSTLRFSRQPVNNWSMRIY